MILRVLFAITCVLCLADCASRTEQAEKLAFNAHWNWHNYQTDDFTLATATPPAQHNDTLWIYIEGDGYAYIGPSTPSSNPTPKNPIALKLAIAHPSNVAVAYLARPCQYEAERNCSLKYWTSARYSEEVVKSLNQAVSMLKSQVGASHVILAGYSGGGALAVLIAARRDDVAKIVTIAANLDLAYWIHQKHLAAMPDSLDPADVAPRLGNIPQLHFTGSDDTIVGTDVVRSFIQKLPAQTPARLIEIKGFTHYCCWEENWSDRIAK